MILSDGGARRSVFKVMVPGKAGVGASTWYEALNVADAGTEWVCCNGGQFAWFPSSVVGSATGFRWSPRGQSNTPGPKVKFTEPSRPCEASCTTGERGASYFTCCRATVAFGKDPGGHRREKIPLCSFHLKVNERRVEKDRRFGALLAEASLEIGRRKETTAVCNATLDNVRPLLAELGVHPKSVVIGTADGGARIGILLPAEVVEMLVERAVALEEFAHEG